LNEDFQDLLIELLDGNVRFLVVGAYAMAVHGVPRATGDIDVWISPQPSNAERAWVALRRFGAPVEQLGVTLEDLQTPGMVVQIGQPPRRIDLLTALSGLDFDEAWNNRTMHSFAAREVPFLGREDLIRNKRASGRPKDLADLDILEGE
jgi:hypothetical protein